MHDRKWLEFRGFLQLGVEDPALFSPLNLAGVGLSSETSSFRLNFQPLRIMLLGNYAQERSGPRTPSNSQ